MTFLASRFRRRVRAAGPAAGRADQRPGEIAHRRHDGHDRRDPLVESRRGQRLPAALAFADRDQVPAVPVVAARDELDGPKQPDVHPDEVELVFVVVALGPVVAKLPLFEIADSTPAAGR